MRNNINRLLQRGARFIAKERDLDQKPSVRATFIEGDNNKYPKAGSLVYVFGKPQVVSGRVLVADIWHESQELSAKDKRNEIEVEKYAERLANFVREKPVTKELPDEIRTRKMPEPKSMYAYQRPGKRKVSHRKTRFERFNGKHPHIMVYYD